MSRSPPSNLTGMLHRGLIVQSHFQAGNLISQLLFILSVTSMEKFSSFSVEGDILILLVWVATKVHNTRWCSSRQALISHPQGYSSNGERCHLAGLCFSFPLHAGLPYVSLGRVRPQSSLQQVHDYFSSKEESHKKHHFISRESL